MHKARETSEIKYHGPCNFLGLPSDVNECSANPCKNGAKCTNNHGDYKCTCDNRFTGKNCDQGMCIQCLAIEGTILIDSKIAKLIIFVHVYATKRSLF